MKKTSLYEIPMLAEIQDCWKSWDTLGYKMATYVFATPADSHPYIPLLDRMRLLRELIATDGKPFYANEVFGASDSLGGWVCGLSTSCLIKATGNTREHFIPVDEAEGLFKKVAVKEWVLAHTPEEMWKAYEEIKMFIVDRL